MSRLVWEACQLPKGKVVHLRRGGEVFPLCDGGGSPGDGLFPAYIKGASKNPGEDPRRETVRSDHAWAPGVRSESGAYLTGDDGERIRFCGPCQKAYGSSPLAMASGAMGERLPAVVDHHGVPLDTLERAERVAARLGRVLPHVGVTPWRYHLGAISAKNVVCVRTSAGEIGKARHLAKVDAGRVWTVCRDESFGPGAWDAPENPGPVNCAPCLAVICHQGKDEHSERVLRSVVVHAMMRDPDDNRPVYGWGSGGEVWRNSRQNLSDEGRISADEWGRAERQAPGFMDVKSPARPRGGSDAKLYRSEAARLATVKVFNPRARVGRDRAGAYHPLPVDVYERLSGLFSMDGNRHAPLSERVSGFDILKETGKLPDELFAMLTTRQKAAWLTGNADNARTSRRRARSKGRAQDWDANQRAARKARREREKREAAAHEARGGTSGFDLDAVARIGRERIDITENPKRRPASKAVETYQAIRGGKRGE